MFTLWGRVVELVDAPIPVRLSFSFQNSGCPNNRSMAPTTISGEVSVATLHLMVGLPCSGKTTLAQKLEHEQSALRLTTDEWHIRLFGQDAQEPEHNARHTLIEMLLWNVASRALELGTNVILDFGFWAREEREDYRSRAKN